MILFNATMWGCYVNSLKALSSLQATVTNFAANFLSSGLAGYFLFQEPLSFQVNQYVLMILDQLTPICLFSYAFLVYASESLIRCIAFDFECEATNDIVKWWFSFRFRSATNVIALLLCISVAAYKLSLTCFFCISDYEKACLTVVCRCPAHCSWFIRT